MGDPAAIKDDGTIRCERYRCTLRAAVCVERQKRAARPGVGLYQALDHEAYAGCEKCPQGEEVKKQVEGERLKVEGKDGRGNDETVIPCSARGENPAMLRPNGKVVNKLCKSCAAAKRAATRMAKKQRAEEGEKEIPPGPPLGKGDEGGAFETESGAAEAAEGSTGREALRSSVSTSAEAREVAGRMVELLESYGAGGNRLVLDVAQYPEVVEALAECARVNLRSPQMQALYFIVRGLKEFEREHGQDGH